MKLWFRRSDGTALAERIAQRDPPHCYTHVELQFDDGSFYSSTTFGKYTGTRFAWLDPKPEQWDSVEIPLSPTDERLVRNFCIENDGEKYDFSGVAAFVTWMAHEDPDKWFCSEVCTAALQVVGLFTDLEPCKTTPNRLYTRAKEQ